MTLTWRISIGNLPIEQWFSTILVPVHPLQFGSALFTFSRDLFATYDCPNQTALFECMAPSTRGVNSFRSRFFQQNFCQNCFSCIESWNCFKFTFASSPESLSFIPCGWIHPRLRTTAGVSRVRSVPGTGRWLSSLTGNYHVVAIRIFTDSSDICPRPVGRRSIGALKLRLDDTYCFFRPETVL